MPATNIPVLTLSITAAVNVIEGQPIGYDGNLAADASAMFGLAENDANAGDQLAVTVLGTGVGIAGGVIANGAQVEVLGGKLVTKAAGVAVGRALQAAAADGDMIEILELPT